ncbi:SIMPL domain-containing protein [Yoonia sp. R2331]|uniref:SIMPL domain-containing protein n=1 Tax=Yoonia sp. R2331 TaxID=3237238 RepID=UPI0034E4ABAC
MRIFLTLTFLALATPALAQDPQISVTGRGEVAVAPDIARITLGVAQEAQAATEAMDLMGADLARVLDGLTAAGIAPADMQTSGLNLEVIRDYNNTRNTPRITGYIARSDIAVTIRDLDALGAVLDNLIEGGANQMNGLQFDVADRAPHLAAARAAAVTDARTKAETFAAAADLTLGAVQNIREGATSGPPMPMMEMRMAADSGPVPVAEGQITISADVAITYALMP